MIKLFLLRHAKSEPIGLFQKDFDREIIQRGLEEMKKLASYFKENYALPDIVFCSAAKRTRQTLDVFKEFNPVSDENIIYKNELYLASASDMLEQILPFQYKFQSILVVGHNFGISELANYLSNKPLFELKTSCMHILEFDSDLEMYKGNLLESIQPKLIE